MKVTEIIPKPTEPKKLRVAAYARVSSEKDAAFHSLQAQTDYYEKYVSNHPEWELVAIYSDNGISGTLIERPAFQEMLESCRAGKIDLIITKSVTRFARNTVILLNTIRELKSLGIDVYFEKEQMHSMSEDGELLLTLLAMYAEEEARSASENQRWRIQKQYEQGKPVSGHVFGYKLIDNKYEVVPDEAEVIKRIYDYYLSGFGYTKISKILTLDGSLSPYGKGWSSTAIVNVLRNEKYAGHLLLQKYYIEDFRTKKPVKNNGKRRKYFVENAHEAIIDQETFDAVQAEIKSRQKKYRGYNGRSMPKHLFRGLLRCGHCNHIYLHGKNSGKEIWRCPTHNKIGPAACPSKQISDDILREKTKEVLGVSEISRDLLVKKINEILVPEHKRLIYKLTDGTSVDVHWDYRSRSERWTEEMKQAARERKKSQDKEGGCEWTDPK